MNGFKPKEAEDEEKDKVLCFKYGKGVLIYNEKIAIFIMLFFLERMELLKEFMGH